MLKTDQIPDAVADSMREFFHTRGDAQKAIAAAINAWPGAFRNDMEEAAGVRRRIILPIPQESSDDQ